jgi:hypothetical protein
VPLAKKSLNWRNAGDYAFTKDLDLAGWAWEFLRRNAEYRSDYAALLKSRSKMRERTPHLRKGVDVVEYGADVISSDEALGIKWCMERAVDPDGDRLPAFSSVYPRELGWPEIQEFYSSDATDAPISVSPPFLVVAFDLSGDIKAQVAKTLSILSNRAQTQDVKRMRQRAEWTIYLRLLDAGDEVSTDEIVTHISDYQQIENDVETGYRRTDRVSDHKAAAKRLLDDPLRMIGKQKKSFPK